MPLKKLPIAIVLLLVGALAACSPQPHPAGINDPYEKVNRGVHGINKGLDRVALRPVAMGYGAVLPQPARDGVRNFSENVATPGYIVNSALQGNPDGVLHHSFRLVVNSTIGIGGLFDVAKRMGVGPDSTDFGETLYLWGAPEGPYVELPLFGPRTGRAAVGVVADFFLDPLFWVLDSPESFAATGAGILGVIDTRYRFRDSIDDVLYESADSYARARIIYLQQRRFELGGDAEQSYVDPSELPEGTDAAATTDPFFDPYEVE